MDCKSTLIVTEPSKRQYNIDIMEFVFIWELLGVVGARSKLILTAPLSW